MTNVHNNINTLEETHTHTHGVLCGWSASHPGAFLCVCVCVTCHSSSPAVVREPHGERPRVCMHVCACAPDIGRPHSSGETKHHSATHGGGDFFGYRYRPIRHSQVSVSDRGPKNGIGATLSLTPLSTFSSFDKQTVLAISDHPLGVSGL